VKFDEVTPVMAEKISGMLKILADPTRLKIMQALHERERCVSDIVAKVGSSQANISKHLALLAQALLVRSEKRGLQVFYRIEDPEVTRLCEAICSNYGKLVKKRLGLLAPSG
jgi:DNA-binding transcriptional ArsR family regulator